MFYAPFPPFIPSPFHRFTPFSSHLSTLRSSPSTTNHPPLTNTPPGIITMKVLILGAIGELVHRPGADDQVSSVARSPAPLFAPVTSCTARRAPKPRQKLCRQTRSCRSFVMPRLRKGGRYGARSCLRWTSVGRDFANWPGGKVEVLTRSHRPDPASRLESSPRDLPSRRCADQGQGGRRQAHVHLYGGFVGAFPKARKGV